jgi:hypothetical protein
MGREGRDEFDESLAPPKPDKMTHGATLFFKLALADEPCSFPEVPWATEVSQDHVEWRSDHTWEFGHHLDMIGDAEEIRDHLFRAIYGSFRDRESNAIPRRQAGCVSNAWTLWRLGASRGA